MSNEIATKEGVILKVGDLVEITRSDKAWNDTMDKLHGKQVVIKFITNSDYIEFEGGGTWLWRYSNKHFKPVQKCYELW